mmetsp:Transcript_84290/g.116480  ORF Transcript_84290/g.116480 Transcript_84290/m.116480 type:complete len:201 (+) Transcript_84290:450-1052(+)
MFVFALIWIKFFIIGMLSLAGHITSKSDSFQETRLTLTTTFSFVVFSQVVDNLRFLKFIIVTLEFVFALWLILMCLSFYHSYIQGFNDINYLQAFVLIPMSFFLTAGIELISCVQLFNWFTRYRIGTIMGLWLTAHSVGLIARFGFSGLYASDFPNIMNAVKSLGQDTMVYEEARYCLFSGIVFIIIAFIDAFTFKFHPL